MERLSDWLNKAKLIGFQPVPYYSVDGDSLTIYFRDDESYAERVNELLTVYRSMQTNELVGCQIKGIQRLCNNLPTPSHES